MHGNSERATLSAWYAHFTARHGNSRTRELYTATWHMVELFTPESSSLMFADITPDWLSRFEGFLSARGSSVNSRSIHLRNIRAVFNDAITNGIVYLQCYFTIQMQI